MINSKIISEIVASAAMNLAYTCQAAELRIYDNNKLIVVKDHGTLRGYYSGSSDSSYISGGIGVTVLCEFVFTQVDRSDGTVTLQAWEKALAIPGAERRTQGALYEAGGQVVINFQQVPNGCRSRKDGDLFIVKPAGAATSGAAVEDQGLHARKIGRENVVGIRLVPMGGTVRTDSGAEAVLPKWALVVLIKQQSETSHVRYVDPATGHATEGWTLSGLINPFLKAK